MLEILTPLAKVERVSRKVTPATFVASPGIWAAVQSDGSLANVTTDTPSAVNKMVISSSSASPYESHDIEVGRIATVESIGVRVKIDSALYIGSPAVGHFLYVSTKAASKGKLGSVTGNPDSLSTGTYELVARVEEVNAAGWIIIRTVSPTTHTFT